MSIRNNTMIHISNGTIARVILFVLGIWLIYYLRDLMVILLTAIVFASAIEPATKWFMKYKIPRVAAVLLVYMTVVGFLFGLFYFFIPPILDEAVGFFATVPQYIDAMSSTGSFASNTIQSSKEVVSGVDAVQGFSIQELVLDLRSSISNVSEGFLRALNTIFGGIFSLILILVFSFYFAVQEKGISDFLKIITPDKHEKYIVGLWKRSQIKIGRWMQGQVLLAVIIGVLTYLGLTIFGVPYALLLAVIAALFELIPIFGPILASIPAIAVAFGSVDGGLTLALMVAGLYLIIQQFENHLIYPLVVKKVVGVPPILVIIALIVGAKLAGFLGIILSVPIAAVLQEVVDDIQKEKKLVKNAKKTG